MPTENQPYQEEGIPYIDGEYYMSSRRGQAYTPAKGWTSTTLTQIPRRDMVNTMKDAAERNAMRDKDLLAALLLSENGQTDLEFGYGATRNELGELVNDPNHPTWVGFDGQAGGAAFQIEANAKRYEKKTGKKAFENGRYTDDFITDFSLSYAPPKADNDPENKNINHVPNVLKNYKSIQETPFDWEEPIDDVSLSQDEDTYQQYQDQLETFRLEQSLGLINKDSEDSLITQMIDGMLELNEQGTAKFYQLLARTGLTYTQVDPTNLPERMTGEEFLQKVLGVDPIQLEEIPFEFDPDESLTLQLLEWDKQAQNQGAKGLGIITKFLASDTVTPIGIAATVSGMGPVKKLGKTILAGLRKLNILPADAKSNAKKLAKAKESIKKASERKKYITEIQAKSAQRVAGDRPKLSLDERTQAKLDDDMFTENKWDILWEESVNLLKKPIKPLTDRAARIRLIRSNEYVDEVLKPLAQVYKGEPTDSNFDEWLKAYNKFLDLGDPTKAAISKTGAALKAQGNELEMAAKIRIKNLNEIVNRGITTPEAMMDNILNIRSLPEQVAIGKAMSRPGAWKIWNAQLVGGFLSGPSTWLGLNLVGNFTNTAMWLSKHQLMAAVPGSPIEAHETWDAIKAMHKAFDAEYKLFWKNLNKPTVRFGKTKLETLDVEEQFSVFKAADLPLPTSLDFLRPALDKMAHAGQFFIRMAIAQDEFTKGLVYQANLSTEAARYVRNLPGSETLSVARKRQMANDIHQQMHLHPHKFPNETRRSRHQGGDVTLTNPLNPTGEAIIELANSHPAIKMWMLFMRTPTNGFTKTFSEFPLVNTLRDTFNGKLFSKDAHIRSEAIARSTMSGAIGVGMWNMTSEGFFSGPGDPDPAKRAAMYDKGWRPGSLMFDTTGDGEADTFIQVPLGVPLFNIMFLTAGIQQAWDFLTDDERDKFTQMMALTINEYLDQQPFLETMAGLAKMREAWASGQGPGDLEEWLKQRAPNYVPIVGTTFSSLRDQTTRAVDPIKREIPGSLGELNTYYEIVMAHVPGFSRRLAPTIDVYGDYERYSDGWGPRSTKSGAFGRLAQKFSPGLTAIKTSQTTEDARKFTQLQFAIDNGTFWEDVPETWEGVQLSWTQRQAIKLLAGKGKITPGFEQYGLLPTKQLLEGEMVDVIEQAILKPTSGRTNNGDGTFRLSKVDAIKERIKNRQKKAFDLLKNEPLFANVAAEIRLRNDVQPLKHQRDTIGRPPGINLKPLLDLF